MTTILPVTTPEQIARVASLAAAIWRHHYTPIVGKDLVDYMLHTVQSPAAIASQINSGNYHYVLLSYQHNDAGYAATTPSPTPNTLRLSKIYVSHQYRGLNLGKSLLDYALQRAAKLNYDHLDLTVNKYNSQSIAWYQHHHFKITDSIVADIGNGFVMDDYIMSRHAAALH